MGDNPNDHDLLIHLNAVVGNMNDGFQRLLSAIPSKDSVQRAHQRIDVLQKYLLGVAAFAAVEGFAIIKMLLIDKG